MLGAADDPFITLLRDGSRAAATPSGLQVSPAQRSLSWPALIRVRLWLVWQMLGVNYHPNSSPILNQSLDEGI